MIELFQFPWSPFCIVQHHILSFSGVPFKVVPVPNTERALVWKLTRQRYYGVPILRDGKSVLFEVNEDSQVLAKYLDSKLKLGLFPWKWEGVQSIVWRHIENKIEGPCFKLNDVYWREMVPEREHAAFVRHKERKFGRGCLEAWKSSQKALLAELEQELVAFEEMLGTHAFLLEERPRFVDFDLYGMLENFLYSGHYRLPRAHNRLAKWHQRMKSIQFKDLPREEELHS
jgi:glutathione S-transferase